MKWAIEIIKTGLGKKNLIDLLAVLGYSVQEEDQSLLIHSPLLENCTLPQEVMEKAMQIRDAFTGPANIDPEFTVGGIIDYSTDDPKRLDFLDAKSAKSAFTVGKPSLSVLPPQDLSEEELSKWHADREKQKYQSTLESQLDRLVPAFNSSRALQVLVLLSLEQQTGETLYKIFELMVGSKNLTMRTQFLNQFNITDHEFDRFKDAVHNPNVSGNWARHAIPGKLHSNNPMTNNEAEVFIRNLANRWLNHIRTNQ